MKKKHSKEIASSSNTQVVESEEELESSSSSSEEYESEREKSQMLRLRSCKKQGLMGLYPSIKNPSRRKSLGELTKIVIADFGVHDCVGRPMGASCKKPVSRFREVVQAPKKVVRDPRFESLSGEVDIGGFRKRYHFLFENNLPAEREELKKQLKKSNDQKAVDQLKKRISWIDKQLKYKSSKQTDAAILAEHKRKEREAAKQGKRPFYLKKSELRKQRLIKEYIKLKESGKLESFIEKRRRKNASKDHRYMPYRRSSTNEQQA